MTKVSCLMLTLDRFEHFERSFACYCRQTYSARQLIVVCDGAMPYVERIGTLIRQRRRQDVKLVYVAERLPVGALRNIAIEIAEGPLVCQWDDDDLYHPDRLRLQIEHMESLDRPVSFLVDQLQFFWDQRELYWCDWSFGPTGGIIPGTILARKDVLPRYPGGVTYHEDLALVKRIGELGIPVARLAGKGYLYVYSYHGANNFQREHHVAITKWAGTPVKTLRRYLDTLKRELAGYPALPPLSIVGSDGEVAGQWNG